MGLINRLLGRSAEPPADVYLGLRSKAIRARPHDLGLTPDPAAPIHGVLMETGDDGSVATFVVLADGTVSLYLSTGGGVIGGGQHEEVNAAAVEMLALTNKYATDYIRAGAATTGSPLPQDGQVFFYLLTSSGLCLARCKKADLANRNDPFANLFENCHAVMAELREATQRWNESRSSKRSGLMGHRGSTGDMAGVPAAVSARSRIAVSRQR
jgi:hypothetical protein